jgi:hypothetical protein
MLLNRVRKLGQVPLSLAADLITHLAAFFDLAEARVQQQLQAALTTYWYESRFEATT